MLTSSAHHLPYTWDDYRSWDDDRRWEIIGGEAYAMSPAPSVRHQLVQTGLLVQIHGRLAGRPCRAIPSPVDVRLSDQDVVQPDIIVVCDPGQDHRTHIEGPPSLVIEILSPSTGQYDRVVKMDLYARAGLPEVWLVTPFPQSVEIFRLDGDGYRRHAAYTHTQTLTSPTLPEIKVDLAPVFDFPLDPDEQPPAVQEPPGRYRAATGAEERRSSGTPP